MKGVDRRPTVAINTLSVSEANEGTRTMLAKLIPALARQAPDLRLLLFCSPTNRHLFESDADWEILLLPLKQGNAGRRIWHDQWSVPRMAKGRADLLITPSSVGVFRCPIPQLVIVSAHLVLPSSQALAGPEFLSPWHRLYFGPVLRRSMRAVDRVLGISQHLADGLVEELGLDPSSVGSMPLGVDPPSWNPRRTRRDPLVIFVGTLYSYKDATVALEAFISARDRLPADARLVIAGRDPGGDQTPRLLAAAEAAGASDRVDVAGPVSDKELEELYSRAAAFILPSRCEGFGLPAAEAMSRGVPVIAARSTALTEVVDEAGLLVEPGDITGFAEALVRVVTNDEVRAELIESGYARAAELSWDATASRLRDEIEATLG